MSPESTPKLPTTPEVTSEPDPQPYASYIDAGFRVDIYLIDDTAEADDTTSQWEALVYPEGSDRPIGTVSGATEYPTALGIDTSDVTEIKEAVRELIAAQQKI